MRQTTNVAYITLPTKNMIENEFFLESYGLTIIVNNKESMHRIIPGNALRHYCGIVVKIREIRKVSCGKGSVCTRLQLTVSNDKIPSERFQELFFDYLNI